jgi:HEAT repeat protein
MNDSTIAQSERDEINVKIAEILVKDKFWGIRLEAATVLTPKGEIARRALTTAATEENAKVRAKAIMTLATSKDPSLNTAYIQSLKDQSYAVIGAAAVALGETKSAEAYPALAKLIAEPSWRDSIKISALNGLAALGDNRGLEVGLKFAEKGNPPAVRAAALKAVGAVAKSDARAYSVLSLALSESLQKADSTVASAAAEGLASFGDPRALPLFEEAAKNPNTSSQLRTLLGQLQERLRRIAATPASATRQP